MNAINELDNPGAKQMEEDKRIPLLEAREKG
jgi:hypothetical protein